MNRSEIRDIAKEMIAEYVTLTDKAYLVSLTQKHIKITQDRKTPGAVELQKAWIARFIDDGLYKDAWIELALDEQGKFLRITRSR